MDIDIIDIQDISRNFNQIYDMVRVVDPTKNEVIDFSGNKELIGFRCYDLWKNQRVCTNCISIRASQTNNTQVKIEYDKKNIYWAMAVPIEKSGERYVVELLKDITNCGIIINEDKKSVEELKEEIEHLNTLVVTDHLTECFNRRFVDERLVTDVKDALENIKQLSVVILDLDFFKSINDEYGHLFGDEVLKSIAHKIKEMITPTDWVARVGGEEFLAVLHNKSSQESYDLAMQMIKEISKIPFQTCRGTINVTASAGVAMLSEGALDVGSLLELADSKLYTAKKIGRNKVVI